MKPRRTILSHLLAFLLSCAGIAAPAARAQTVGAQTAPTLSKGRAGEAFVIYQNEAGETTCRVADAAERRRILGRGAGGETRVIYAGAPQLRMASGVVVEAPQGASSSDTIGPLLLPSAGLRIVLHGTTQLSQNQTARNAFIVAANRWESLISTPVTVVIDVDFGVNAFGDPFPSPDILGETGTEEFVSRLADARQRLLANSPTANEQQLYNSLPSAAVTTERNGSTFNSTTVLMSRANARALGLAPDISSPDALALGAGDASIAFNSSFSYDFNPDNGISSSLVDFDAVATHEIGHALGFLSESGGPVYAPASMWDVFRFRPGAASVATFGSVPRLMSAGGQQVYFNNQTNIFGTQELELSTGGPFGSVGDGEQSSHWKDDDLTGRYIGIMDPTLSDSVRSVITSNDTLALDSFGYSLGASVPHPAPPPPAPTGPPANDNFAAATTLQGAAGTITGDSTGATKEAGEPVHPASPGGRSVWFNWTAPASGSATFDTEGSGFDTILAVYTGGSLSALTRIASNDDIASGFTNSRVTFTATAGTTYRIAVDGFINDANVGAEFGITQLNWSASVPPPLAATIQFVSVAYSVVEHERSVGIIVTRAGDASAQQFVNFNVQQSASRVQGNTSQTLAFAPGETLKIVALDIADDATPGPGETATLTLSNPTNGASLGTPASATLNILDDDAFPANVVQFAGPASQSVGESAGKIDLTVTRTGDTSQEAFVTYATVQGDALETRDYTFARATLRFAPNEASKSFSVLITDDSYAELNELFSVQLISAVGTTINHTGSVVSVQITDNDAQNGPNPLDNSSSYVRLHYHDFLNREPDTSGLQFWTGEIETCGSDLQCREVRRVNVSGAFFLSIEFQNTGYLVYRTYKAAYGNMSGAPVPVRLQEFLPDTLEIGRGVQVGVGNWEQQLEANKQAFFGEFVTRGRFKTALPPELSPAQFVDALNANAGGVLSATERDALVAQLAASNTTQTRAAVLRQIAENQRLNSNEFKRAFVLMQYFGYLRRDPNAAPDSDFNGYNFWLSKLNQFNGDFVSAEMVKAFINSAEYRARFGP